MSDRLAGGFRIGDHAVEPARGRIVSPAGETHVEPRAMDVLVALARKAGDTVGRDELIESVWKHPYVSDEALSRVFRCCVTRSATTARSRAISKPFPSAGIG